MLVQDLVQPREQQMGPFVDGLYAIPAGDVAEPAVRDAEAVLDAFEDVGLRANAMLQKIGDERNDAPEREIPVAEDKEYGREILVVEVVVIREGRRSISSGM